VPDGGRHVQGHCSNCFTDRIVIGSQDKISAKEEGKDGESKEDDDADADDDEADEVRLGLGLLATVGRFTALQLPATLRVDEHCV
jgi:hypothetical protein